MFFEFICLFFALMDIIICLPSPNYSKSNTQSSRILSSSSAGHVSTIMFQNMLPLQHQLDYTVQQKSVRDSQTHSSLDSNAPTIRITSFASSSPIFTKIFQNEQLLEQLKNEDGVVKKVTQRREKRGIVLIDDDFNVSPEPGVKQGWGDGDFDKNSTKSGKKSIEIMSTEEGSGQMDGLSSIGAIQNTTPEQLQISTDTIKGLPTKEYDKMISTSEHSDKATSTSEHIDKMVSTSEHADKMVSTSEHIDKATSTSEHADKMVSTSEHVDVETSSLDYRDTGSTTEDIEGSGEISVSFTQLPETTEEPKEQDGKSTMKVCLKHTCNPDDLLLSPGITRKVPEGTNLTLSCSSVNSSGHELLKLYKYNDSDSPLLQESDKEQHLNFDIPLSQRHHSGTYMCLKFTEESCCSQQLEITVYEVPSYRTHLIVVGLIAAISLFTCILLGIYRSFKTKNYEVQMELQNMEKPVIF